MSLAHRSIVAAKWNVAGNVLKAALQFCFGIVLARLLGPEAFGTIAIALLMIGLGALISDLGFGAALVQQRQLDRRDIDFVFTFQIGIGLFLTGISFLAAGPVAQFFTQPAAVPVIQCMAVIFLIRALGQTARALLSRELRFKAIQGSSIGTYLVAFGGVGVPMALSGHGVWSLVWAQLVQASLEAVILLLAARPIPRFAFRRGGAPIFRIGGSVVAANIGSWMIMNLDAVIVGRSLGSIPLGLYNRAMTMLAAPGGALVAGLQGVLFSACSRAEGDPVRVKRAYLATTSAATLVCIPFYMAAAAAPGPIILALYGEAWVGAIPLLAPLALAMGVYSVLALIGPVLMALDRTMEEVSAQYSTVLITAPVLYAASSVSLVMVGWAVLVLNFVRLSLLFRGLRKVVGIGLGELASVIAPPLAIGVASFATVSLADLLVRDSPASVRLLVAILVAASTLLAMTHILRRRLFNNDLRTLLGAGPVSALLARWLGA